MKKTLQNYALNKVLSIGWVFAVIVISGWYFGTGSQQWQFLLLALIAFGYTHFLVGFYYQCRAFFRKQNPWQHVLTFLVLALVSLIVAELLFALAGFAFALFVGFAYFLLHGLFNEQTLVKREANIDVPLLYISSLALFVFVLLAYTVPDPTFIFTRTLEFLSTDVFTMTVAFATMGIDIAFFKYFFWGGVVISFILLGWAWMRTKSTKLTLFLASSYLLIIFATVFVGAMKYVYMYFLVVGYHFITWFIFYARDMFYRPRGSFRDFLLLHALVLLPFLVGGWLFFADQTPQFVFTIFDYKYFVVATYIHISTSFMNDEWFQKIQSRVFGN